MRGASVCGQQGWNSFVNWHTFLWILEMVSVLYYIVLCLIIFSSQNSLRLKQVFVYIGGHSVGVYLYRIFYVYIIGINLVYNYVGIEAIVVLKTHTHLWALDTQWLNISLCWRGATGREEYFFKKIVFNLMSSPWSGWFVSDSFP